MNPHRKIHFPMYQLASPLTEWEAPGAFTRRLFTRYQLFPNYVPGPRRNSDSRGRGNVTTHSSNT